MLTEKKRTLMGLAKVVTDYRFLFCYQQIFALGTDII
jgi:hypothetical protein